MPEGEAVTSLHEVGFELERGNFELKFVESIKQIVGHGRKLLGGGCAVHLPPSLPFHGSTDYWQSRYLNGGDSGIGSYGDFARFKADVLNAFVHDHGIESIIEFGCGDGNQLLLANYPDYLGIDVSSVAIDTCSQRFSCDKKKRFMKLTEYCNEQADLSLSLDVIYHLVEDDVYDHYMTTLFNAAKSYVAIYSSNGTPHSDAIVSHVRHRCFTDWVKNRQPQWRLFKKVPNRYPFQGDYRRGSFSDFYFFEKY